MKNLFILASVIAVLFVAAPDRAGAQSKQSNLAPPEFTKVSLPEGLARQIVKDDSAKLDAKWLVENVTTTLTSDLNGDGKPEWLIGLCGNHDCSGWIYRKVGERYEMIFSSYVGDPVALSTSSNGYRDLETGNGTYVTIYKFDGRHYKVTECRKYKVTHDRNGEILSRKLVHRGPCPK